MSSPPKSAPAIEHAVRIAAAAMLERGATRAEAIAIALASLDGAAPVTPRERVREGRQAQRERMLAEYADLVAAGREHEAASVVARKFAIDRHDPVEIDSLARKIRRWRQNETDSVRLAPRRSSRNAA